MAPPRPAGGGEAADSRHDHEQLSLTAAADRLGVHYMTVYRYVRTGRLPATKVGGEWRVDGQDVNRMLASVDVDSGKPVGPVPARGSASVRTRFRRRLEDRLVAGDEAGAWSVVESAQAAGATPGEIYLDLLAPAMASIGDRWESGALDVGGEHRASAVAIRLIGRLGPRFARRGRKRGTVVVGAPPGERHGIPVAMVADMLVGAGFEVLSLGADSPAETFAETVREAAGGGRLVAVVIGVTVAEHLVAAGECVAAVRGVIPGGVRVPVLVGGAAVRDDETVRKLGATGSAGTSATDAVAEVERLVPATRAG